jgi:hypothetical protein
VIAVLFGLTMPNAFMNGMVVGAGLVVAPGGVGILAMQVTGSAPIMMGDQAEQWTAQVLRPLMRRDWQLVNHLVLGTDDIDHVLLGPGGAFVIETKWSGSPWDSKFGTQRQLDAIRQAVTNARTLRLWHPLKSREILVHPVVVLWGRGMSKWPITEQVRHRGSAVIVAGPALKSWANHIGGADITPSDVEGVWQAIEAQIARRDPLDLSAHPLPTSLAEWAARAGLSMAVAVATLCAFTLLLKVTNSTELTLALSVPVAVCSGLAARLSVPAALRWAVWSWTGVLGGLCVASAVAEIVYRIR